ncbi:MAG: MbcA/ParS/Xre antitoxin family protein [Gammaproteobacteria bacterium]|nr:MbcA/ParS/Xre antitoxin family protein [Gammaproteobacteria bacterium]MBU1504470.1 MbcA/ParS/Xre antitoxin family protein [Gammaproteobacteria bacterium]MBU2118928.1 MbcA/ParS/Xre antitoxin family protein [Gammaproteobacteria bacterium]MBU2171399.1 MbcA/ParS/Xre antitoxin family protein [Gammaproteobacteria bacterium]MBU2201228.1 MbcA/ParS/Xre antitoxin family protein [Gammaproteobacteria bacterium]
MPPVGRELGSPAYERLAMLAESAFAAFQSWERAREWLAKPNAQIDGASPEDAALIPAGLNRVMAILQIAGQATSDEFDPDHP